MKKIAAWMLCLALLMGAAFAEEEYAPMPKEAGAFDGLWKCGDTTVTLDWEEEGFRVNVRLEKTETEATEWEYSCFYNQEDNSLSAAFTGIRTEYVYDDAGETKSFNEVYNDGDATFTIDGEGHLLWQDAKEDAGKDMRFVKIGNSKFEGVWACDRASIEVVFEEEGYRVFIAWASSASEETEWEYNCLYNAQEDALVSLGNGICTDVTFDGNGDAVSYNVKYEDGDATFAIDGEGHLLWQDAKEDAGKDMRFEWMNRVDVDL